MADSESTGIVLEVRVLQAKTRFISIRLEGGQPDVYVGTLPHNSCVIRGDEVRFEGMTRKPPFRGQTQSGFKQVCVTRRRLDNVAEPVFKHLLSENMHGVGPTTAKKLYSLWGSGVVTAMQGLDDGSMTAEEFGAGPPGTAGDAGIPMTSVRMKDFQEQLADFFGKVVHSISALTDLTAMGFSLAISKKALADTTEFNYQTFVERVRENPYRMLKYASKFCEVDDACVQYMEYGLTAPERIRAIVRHIIDVRHRRGGSDTAHTIATVMDDLSDELSDDCPEVLAACRTLMEGGGVSGQHHIPPPETADHYSTVVIDRNQSAGFEDAVYTPAMHSAEAGVASSVHRLLSLPDLVEQDAQQDVRALIETAGGLPTPDEKQVVAVRNLLYGRISALHGLPGGGKSAAVAMMVAAIHKMDIDKGGKRPRVVVLSFTGKAVARINELLRSFGVDLDEGDETRTIHSYLARADNARADRTESRPVYIIVDEASMMSLELADRLFSHIVCNLETFRGLALVGDSNQLPSIDPGTVLRDVLSWGGLPTVTLEKSHRNVGLITQNAANVATGLPMEFDGETCRLESIPYRQNTETVCEKVMNCLRDQFNGASPVDLPAVLCRTRTAVQFMNVRMQGEFNPPKEGLGEFTHFGSTFRVGDRAMNVKNVSSEAAGATESLAIEGKKEKFKAVASGARPINGDVGFVTAITPLADGRNAVIAVTLDDGTVVNYCTLQHTALRPMKHLVLAYAFTVHKSQGSQYDTVYSVMPPYPTQLVDRSMLLTAVSRAQRRLVVFGGQAELDEEVTLTAMTTRVGFLQARLVQSATERRPETATRHKRSSKALESLETAKRLRGD